MNKKRGIILVLLTAIISGFSIFINKFGVQESNPYLFAFAKNTIVALFLFSLIILTTQFNKLKELKKKDWINLSLVGLLGGSIPFLLFFKGLQLTTSSSGSFMHKTIFIFVIFFSLFFLREKLNKYIFIPAILLLVGNFLILKLNSFTFSYGELLILIAAIFWAGEFVLSKHLLKRLESNIVGFGRMFFGSLFILIFLLSTNQPMEFNLEQAGWIFITSIFLFLYVLTWYNGLKHINVTTASCILLLGSPITTILSFVFLGSVISLTQVVGILLISLGIVLIVYLNPISKMNEHVIPNLGFRN